jgi:diguanylate cyclase (GGDEF)-like protein
MLVVAHKLDVFAIELDLLDPANHTMVYAANSNNVDAVIDMEDGTPEIDCSLRNSASSSFCALSILLSPAGGFKELKQGRDLSLYDTLDIDVRYSAPAGSPNIRVTFRNYHPNYVVTNDYSSLKYNTFSFEPHVKNFFSAVPLNGLRVERWWIETYKVKHPFDKLDFSNIAFIEVFPSDVKHSENYQMWVNHFVLKGQIISELTLYSIILVTWALVICYLIYRNAMNLRTIAELDTLTGVSNRRGLFSWVQRQQHSLLRRHSVSVVYIDLDDFKKINDIYGHAIGDQVLIAFSEQIKRIIKSKSDTPELSKLCRIAADEFVLALFDVSKDRINTIIEALIASTKNPFRIQERLVKTSVSIGICNEVESGKNLQHLIDKACMAMSSAKKSGKNQYRYFDTAIQHEIDIKKQVSKSLKSAVDDQAFYLSFMPICSAKTFKIKKIEVLIRTNSRELKGIGPDTYIPIAEEYNLIHEIDLWVIEQTLEVVKKNREILETTGVVFCINISALELHHHRFVTKLEQLFKTYDVSPKYIELEITETSLVDVDARSIQTMEALKTLGVGLALDDFGTGYAAFSQLHNYPVNCLKIDKSFILDLDLNNDIQLKVIKTVLNIAETYSLETVAEGVETSEQLAFLQKSNCQLLQGYMLSEPVSWESMLSLLIKGKPLIET